MDKIRYIPTGEKYIEMTGKKILLCMLLLIGIAGLETAIGQELAIKSTYMNHPAADNRISLELRDVPMDEALVRLARKANVGISFNANLIPDKSVSISFNNVHPYTAFIDLLNEEGLEVALASNGTSLVIKKREQKSLLERRIFSIQSGEIRGRVIDATSGEPLPGANIIIANTAIGAATNVNGEFLLRNVPEGEQTIQIGSLGYRTQIFEVVIITGETKELEIELAADVIEGDEMIIYSQALGQAQAIRSQLASNTIVNVVSEDRLRELPDANAAEAVGRLPGVSLLRSGGEGSKVAIRGLGPEFSSITIDGVRIPGTSGDRSVDLSMISSEMLAGIEVYKSVRPDMDADAIGGSVNFRMGQAPTGRRYRLKLDGGYSSHINGMGTYKAAFSGSDRFLNDRLGVIATINAQQVDRSDHTLSASYNILRDPRPGEPHAPIEVTRLILDDTQEIRQRYGGSVALDWNLPNGKLFTRNSLNNQHRPSMRLQRRYELDNNRTEWRVREREIDIFTMNNTLAGEHSLGIAEVEWSLSRSYTSNRTPIENQTVFREDSAFDFTLGDPQQGGPEIIPLMALNRIERAYHPNGAVEMRDQAQRDYVASLDIQIPTNLSRMLTGYVKFGGKHYNQYRYRNNFGARIRGPSPAQNLARYDMENDNHFPWIYSDYGFMSMRTFMTEESVKPYTILNGQYVMEHFPDPWMATDIWHKLGYHSLYVKNHHYTFDDYNATERISAGYVMTELNIGPRFMILPGVRYEHEHSDYQANIGTYHVSTDSFDRLDDDDRDALIRDTTATRNMGMWFPMVQARYRLTEWFDIRAARTTTITRPNFSTVTPRLRISHNSGRVRRGDAQIRPMKSTNYDLFFTFHQNRLGLLTLGGFYKEVEDLIFTRDARLFIPEESGLPRNTLGYDITEPVNNENLTTVRGFEVEWQSNLTWLSSPFNGLVFNVNYSRQFSEAHYHGFKVERTPQGFVGVDTFRVAPMLHQADHIANASVGYDYRGFSSRVSMQYQGATLRSIGRREEEHRYTDDYLRFDATIRQRVWRETARMFVNLHNLTNRPDRSSQFTYDRPRTIEYYGASFDIGIEFRF